uniref:Uncharacterized protein n=1 Tax=Anguilla anguilla TaxID=7936 RepID=A0A0E9XBP4_ANGAN
MFLGLSSWLYTCACVLSACYPEQ